MKAGSAANVQRPSVLGGDAEHLLEAYEQRCGDVLADFSPEERREVYEQLDLTVEVHPEGSRPPGP